MRFFVTGGSGFVGSSVIKELLKQKNETIEKIISIDNYSSGYLHNEIQNPKVKYIKCNTWDINNIDEIREFDPDVIFHFGEFSRIVHSFDDPSLTFRSNTYGTQQVFEYAVKKNAKLIYSGSSSIFGNNMDDQHLNPYSWTKAKNIELLHNYKKWFGLNFAICYFFNVYGPGQITSGNYATVIGIFEKQYENNLPLTVVHPGTQTRAFTHIDDIVKGIILISEKGNGDKYFLGTEENISILDIVEMFKSDYTFIPERRGERLQSLIHSSRARTELGWSPNIQLTDYVNSIREKYILSGLYTAKTLPNPKYESENIFQKLPNDFNWNEYDALIVGCGISGSTIAYKLAVECGKKVLIVDNRNHIGGNMYDYIDKFTKIRIAKYGVHLFHTNDDYVWNFIQKFTEWIPYEHRVKANIIKDNKYVLTSLPPNLNTVNDLYSVEIKNEEDMKVFIDSEKQIFENPANSEESALSRAGISLYNDIFKHYTRKQWNKYPNELDPSVLERIPIRYNHDDRYFTDKHQYIPKKGYTDIFKNMLNHENITVLLNTDFFDIRHNLPNQMDIIYSGPIDRYYASKGYDKLEYRTVYWDVETINKDFYQTDLQINYPGEEVEYTRIIEYKHQPNQICEYPHTIIFKEHSGDDGEPYYPVPNSRNKMLYEKYKKLAQDDEKIHFVGRLATYKYMNMDQAIKEALNYFEKFLNYNTQ